MEVLPVFSKIINNCCVINKEHIIRICCTIQIHTVQIDLTAITGVYPSCIFYERLIQMQMYCTGTGITAVIDQFTLLDGLLIWRSIVMRQLDTDPVKTIRSNDLTVGTIEQCIAC